MNLSEGMVTLRSGPELEVDGPGLNYNSDGSEESVEEGSCGAPRAVLTCRKNSHPFKIQKTYFQISGKLGQLLGSSSDEEGDEERVLTLEHPVKIGRSVARSRPSPCNGIFDCKVLSRNHALMWYDKEKFYIQDTKSSNGTFVNGRRLSQGSEESLMREIWSGDVLQFGVDVLENRRKGNGETENSDDSVHIVTHGCIVASLKLILPNGKVAKQNVSSNIENTQVTYPQEEICKLQHILFEAHQREERLHCKLQELYSIMSVLQESCEITFKVRLEESKLLSKIENHEKKTKVFNKIKPGSMEAAEIDVVHQLLRDVEKVQMVSQEIQERLHNQLMESEDSLTTAKMDASNLKLEVQNLRDLANRSENSVQEIATKCSNYVSTIENLEAQLNIQLKNNSDLEGRVSSLQQETEQRKFFTQNQNNYDNLISDEWDDELPQKMSKECNPIISEWYAKCYPILKNKINEEDSLKLMRRLLESTFADMEQAKKEFEKLSAQKEVLLLKLEAARSPSNPTVKIEIFEDLENDDILNITPENATNEEITQLEDELKEVNDMLWEASFKKKIFEARCGRIKLDLDTAMNLCAEKEKSLLVEKTDCDDSEMTVEHIRHFVETLTTETEKKDKSYEKLILTKRHDETTQTDKALVKNVETNTDKVDSNSKTAVAEPEYPSFSLDGNTTIRRGRSKDIKQFINPIVMEMQSNSEIDSQLVPENLSKNVIDDIDITDQVDEDERDSFREREGSKDREDREDKSASSTEKSSDVDDVNFIIEDAVNDASNASKRLEELLKTVENHPQSMTMWDKIKRIHDICHKAMSEVPRSAENLQEIKSLLNLVSEDLVALLVREQKMSTEQNDLQIRLDQSLTQADVAALSLADRFLALVIGLVICYIGSRFLEYLGFEV